MSAPKSSDSFDQDFNNNMKASNILLEKLTLREKEVAQNWLNRLKKLQNCNTIIKKTRNHFMKKLLEVIQQSVIRNVLTQPKGKELSPDELEKLKDEVRNVAYSSNTPILNKILNDKDVFGYMSMWSDDRRTYVAAKPIPGRGAIIYMAVSEKPELGWDIPDKYNK